MVKKKKKYNTPIFEEIKYTAEDVLLYSDNVEANGQSTDENGLGDMDDVV